MIKKVSFLFIILGISLWFLGINDPYVGGYGAANTLLSLAAKNYLKFGYLKLHFLPTYFVGSSLPLNPPYYLHHPIGEFILLSFAFKLFGFQNWVGYLVPFIFSLGSLLFIYKIGSLIWNKNVGLCSVVLASMMPILTVFGVKQAGFEQGVLFMLLGILFFSLKYIIESRRKNLLFISLFSLGAIFIDWGALYFLPLFLLLYKYFPNKERTRKVILCYGLPVFLGVLTFLIIILFTLGNFQDLLTIIKTRTADPELFGLSYPILRLILLTLVRSIIYFTPLIAIAGFIFLFRLPKLLIKKTIKLNELILVFLFLLGMVNIVIVPANSWQHIYFLFYWIPFFAFSGGLFLSKMLSKKILLLSILLFTFFWAMSVSYYKWRQLNKQIWRFDVGKEISTNLSPYKTIGVYGFPGDILSYYFNHPSIPLKTYDDLDVYLQDKNNVVIFSCWGSCSEDDKLFIEKISLKKQVTEYGEENKRAWLIKDGEIKPKIKIAKDNINIYNSKKTNLIENVYRKIRDIFQVGQL